MASTTIKSSSQNLEKRFDLFNALGASSFSVLFDRRNTGAVGRRLVLGPPARREFNAVPDERHSVLNMATSGYLDLGNDVRVKHAAQAAIERFGTHSGGCRLLSGTTDVHYELEELLARFMGACSVLTYTSGYVTNLSVVSALFGPGDLIVLDRQAHRSLYDGAILSRAAIKRFRHNDVEHLDAVLRRTSSIRRRLVVVDAVYSMEGDLVPLPDLLAVTKRHRAFLLVDEAHAFGVLGSTGRGLTEHFNLDPASIDIRIGTLSKAAAAAGGFAAVDAQTGALLRYASHGRVFSASMTPADTAAALAALTIMEQEPWRTTRLRANADTFRAALDARGVRTGGAAAIVPVVIGERLTTLEAGVRLLDRGLFVNPVVAPGVPTGAERLRCLLCTSHEESDLHWAAQAIADVIDELRQAA